VLGLPWSAVLEILGHELTHVLQQRGDPLHASPADIRRLAAQCESQAHEIGGRFAANRPAPPHAASLAHFPRRPQCLVSVAGQLLRQVDDLAPKTQTVLALIDGAERWLSWAIPARSAFFRFADETALVTGIQQGLHGSALMLLPRLRLRVHPRKLWTLADEQLSQLLSYEGDDEDNDVLGTSLQSVLNENGIYAQQSLASGRQYLRQLGTAQAPLFQELSLADQVALMGLVKMPPTTLALDRTAQAAASAFAMESAQTPQEFVDYYAFYFETVQRLTSGGASVDAATAVRRVRDSLLDPVQALLACPVVAGVPTVVELYALVNQWVDQKQLIGFPSMAAALRSIAASGPLVGPGEDDRAFQSRLHGFVDGIQQFLKHTEPSARTLSQDGLTYSYPLASKSATARLDRQHDGCVTLGSYRQTPSGAPSQSPRASRAPADRPASANPNLK
jgi:hypothetical protein